MAVRKVTRVVDLLDAAAPGANTNITGATYTPTAEKGGSLKSFSLLVGFANDTVFKTIIDRGGGVSSTVKYWGGDALDGGSLYWLEGGPVAPDATYDFQIETDGAILIFQLIEAVSGSDA